MNPFAQITRNIDPQIIQKIADTAGVKDTAVHGALDVLGPELMQGMFAKLKSGGATELMNILKSGSALASGDDILQRVLGDTLNAVLENISKRVGISVSQARVVASALAPVLIDALGKMGTMDPKMVAKAMGIAKLMGISIPGADAIAPAGEKKKGWLSGLLGR
jgi:uncharacterized protein YidB (DUF937 family)